MNATNQKHIGKQAKMEMGQPLATRHARDGCADGKGQPEAGAETQQHFVLKQLEKEIMEHDFLIAQLESQLSMSRENQKRNTLRLSQERERERQQELQQSQERERQQELQQSQERERQQKLQQSQERERQQKLQQSQERERQQELQQSQERERQQELQQSQERERQQELQQSQERERQQELQQSQERVRQQELQQSQEREREWQDMLLKKAQGGLPELEALIRMTAQIEDLRTFDDTSIFFSRHEWTEWKQVEELLQKNVIKVPSSPQTLPGSAPERLCEARGAAAQGSGNGAVPVVSTSNLNNVRERKYPEKCGAKLQPERLLSIKQRLKLLHCPDRKEPSTPVTNPAVKVTENGATQASCGTTQASCGTTQATAGDEAPHSGTRQFACPECGDIMRSKGGLLKHRSSHNAYKPFACSECGKSFKSKTWLVRHQRTHTGQYPFLCHECGVRFNWKRSLSQHQKIHAKEKSTLEEPSASSKGDELNNSIVEGNNQEKCGNQFSKKKPLGRRQKTLPGGVTFGCNKCEKKFISRYFLYMHRRNIHPAEKPLAINTHGNKVKLKLQRMQVQRNHAGGESTSAEWSLGTNQGLQTGEKSFMCNNCGKCFSRKVKLRQHRRTHTGIEYVVNSSSWMHKVHWHYNETMTNHPCVRPAERPDCQPKCDCPADFGALQERHSPIHKN